MLSELNRYLKGQGALALLANTVAARREPEKAMAILQKVVSSAAILKGARGEAGEVAMSILARLDSINSVPFLRNDDKLRIEPGSARRRSNFQELL